MAFVRAQKLSGMVWTKSNIALRLAKQTTLSFQLCIPHDYNVMPNFTLYRQHEHTSTNLSSCTCITLLYFFAITARLRREIAYFHVLWGTWRSELECGPQEINSREIRLRLSFSAKRSKRDKVWKKRKVTFSLPSQLSIVKLPAPYDTESAGVDWKGTPGACSRVLWVIPKTPWAPLSKLILKTATVIPFCSISRVRFRFRFVIIRPIIFFRCRFSTTHFLLF